MVGKKFDFVQHKLKKHLKNQDLKTKHTVTQAQLEDLIVTQPKVSRSDQLGSGLCKAFLSASIPWNILENTSLCNFWEENSVISIPHESTLRKKHLPDCYADPSEQSPLQTTLRTWPRRTWRGSRPSSRLFWPSCPPPSPSWRKLGCHWRGPWP